MSSLSAIQRLITAALLLALLAGCAAPAASPTAAPTVPSATLPPTSTPAPLTRAECLATAPEDTIDQRVDRLLACMTLAEKIGQMTQVEKNSLKPGDVAAYFLGSVLSGGGGSPNGENSPAGWAKMIAGFQAEASQTRLGIPLIYGVDAVHGHNNLYGATIFPHEVGLGAANDPAMIEKIGRATAEEMLATGATWNFAPVVAVPQDIRWGRTYEAYGEDTALVSTLAAAYIKGLQTLPDAYAAAPGQSIYALATPKHFLGDGGTKFGTSTQVGSKPYLLDQGDMQVDEAAIRTLYLPAYKAAIDAGAMSIMVSFSSWNGVKMHAQKHLLTDVLKGELGFTGFLISDWGAIDQINPGDYYQAVVTAINAGVDMNMVPYDAPRFIDSMNQAVQKGDIQPARIDDAVRRILRAKFMLGLFDHPNADPALQATIRSQAHLDLAREAVRKSLVLLKNDAALPIDKNMPLLLVAGEGAANLGMQAGGWTIEWQGRTGNIILGSTLLEGFQAAVSKDTQVKFSKTGKFTENAAFGIVVVGEPPYAEGVGDSNDLSLSDADINAIKNTRAHVKKLVVVILSGRPLVITDQFPLADAWIAAWLPGSEGAGVADVLFGDYPFSGRLPYSWPRTNEQLPINLNNLGSKTGCDAPLFPFGYGLKLGDPSPVIPTCG